jgi:hypothetical protein
MVDGQEIHDPRERVVGVEVVVGTMTSSAPARSHATLTSVDEPDDDRRADDGPDAVESSEEAKAKEAAKQSGLHAVDRSLLGVLRCISDFEGLEVAFLVVGLVANARGMDAGQPPSSCSAGSGVSSSVRSTALTCCASCCY